MRWRDVKQGKVSTKEPKKSKKANREETLPFASLFDRFKAFVTDTFLIAMPIFYAVIYLIFDGLRGANGIEAHRLESWLYILIPLGLVLTIFWSIKGQSPGMKAYELKVIDTKTKEKPSFILSLTRFIFFNIAFFTILPLFSPYFRKDRQGIWDLLSNTAVIKADE